MFDKYVISRAYIYIYIYIKQLLFFLIFPHMSGCPKNKMKFQNLIVKLKFQIILQFQLNCL